MSKVNLFIVGAVKAGTTYLHALLSEHPEVNMSPVKEPHFFADVDSRNKAEYLRPQKGKYYHSKIIRDYSLYHSLFDFRATQYKYWGEASPSYLLDENSAKRIFSYNPDAKIIIILRDPIERAFSHYLGEYRTGYERQKDFTKAFIKDAGIKEKRWGKKGFFYVELGLYYKQVKRFVDVFGRDNVLIINFSEIKDEKKIIENLCSFLKIRNQDLSHKQSTTNEGLYPNSKFSLHLQRVLNMAAFKYMLNYIDSSLKDKVKSYFFQSKKAKNIRLSDVHYDMLRKYFESDIELLETEFDLRIKNK